MPSEIEFLLLAIKPYQLQEAASDLQKLNLSKNTIIISILAGVSLQTLENIYQILNYSRNAKHTNCSWFWHYGNLFAAKLINSREVLEEFFATKNNKIIYMLKQKMI